MKYRWHARASLHGSAAHLVFAEYPRALCGMLKPAGSEWSDDTMLLACRSRCKACEKRLKLAKYWLTALVK